MSLDLTKLTIHSAHRHLVDGDFSARELIDACLEVIAAKNPDINAYLEVFEDDARAQAAAADKVIKEQGNETPLLAGIPLAIKDNILIEGRIASAASRMLENYTASYDATAIGKLKAQGAVFLGRTNMDEFAMGSSTEHSAFGTTKNPHDPSRVPGGSSGGSAAAVAMQSALGALGSDTGGSVRQPASFCGVVGLKPTYGAVSRSGLIAMGSSLDQIGSFGRTVADTEALFEVIRGQDRLDATTIPNALWNSVERKEPKVVGVPRAFFEKGIDPEVRRVFDESLLRMDAQGFELRDIELPSAGFALSVYYIVMPAEVSTNLARLDGMRYGLHREAETLLEEYARSRGAGFGKETRRRILLGTYVLSAGYYDAYYIAATRVRRTIAREFADVFASGVDLIATPTAPTPAFRFGEKTADPLAMYAADLFTVPANIAGVPAISLPAGFALTDGVKLPVGLQLMAPMMREDALFTAGKRLLGEEA